jgi:hypothetical protein
LHLLVDADTHEIVASALTANDVDDVSQVGPLLDQIGGSFTSFTGDGAYDAEATYRTVAERQPDDPPSVIVPPRSTAVPSRHAKTDPTQRDRHLATLGAKGRMAWQKESGYNRRALAEVMMARYKQIIGSRLWARSLPNQKAEAALAVTALNRMTQAGMPVSVRIT